MKTIDEIAKDIRSNFTKHIVDIYDGNADHDKIDNEIKRELESYRDSLLDEIEKKVSEYENEGNGRHSIMCIKEKIQRMREEVK